VAADVKQVGADERALSAALQGTTGSGSGPAGATVKASTAATSSSTPGAPATAAAATTTGGTGSPQGSSGQSTKKATPQQVAVDQASVDTAQAKVTDAQQALAGADLVSTISGTVGSVSIADGDSVTPGSGSSSAQIVVIGTGSSYDVKTNIAVADIGRVAIGQQALVTPDSTNSVAQGRVSAIGVVAASSSTTTTYPVTISLDSPDLGQLSGADGGVQIVTERSANVTTVPSSAVRTVGAVHVVTVVKNGTPTPTRVTLGTVGDVLTQVTSGVSRGDLVSLATLDQPLPSTTSTATRFGGLGGGGLGGGGLGGGGLGGGGGIAARFAG
jgi:multidrug efflux pump subunit AcrA (membrane-fusion protein)